MRRREQIKKNIGAKRRKHPGNSSLTAPLTPREAHRQAASEARAEYGPTIRAAKGEIRGSKARQSQIGEWFTGLQDQINQSAQASDASSAQANNALLAHAQAATEAAQKAQGQVGQNNAATAALTGADPSLFKDVEAEGAAAAGQRAMTNQMLAAPIAQAGASQAAYLRNTGINAGRESIEQRGLESKRRQKIKEDLTALRKERSQKAIGNFRDIRGEERDYEIQRKAFGLQKDEAAQDAAEGAANRAADERQSRRAQEQDERASRRTAETSRTNNKEDNEGGGDRKGLTPGERRDQREGRQNAMVTARNLYKAAKKPPKTNSEWAAFTQLVAQESEISPQEAQWAVRRLRQKMRNQAPAVAEDPNGASLGR
ncbi:MAG TPA: hypothetical protein VFJ76_07760 [Solirubrobacterales bacterium]|nr:hypothetical protein [Solirubrobacterales bacterium]